MSQFGKKLNNIGKHVHVIQTSINGDRFHEMTAQDLSNRGFFVDYLGFSNINNCESVSKTSKCPGNIPVNAIIHVDTTTIYQVLLISRVLTCVTDY
jgi:hypothetical protein